jgi:hypothetical protein
MSNLQLIGVWILIVPLVIAFLCALYGLLKEGMWPVVLLLVWFIFGFGLIIAGTPV